MKEKEKTKKELGAEILKIESKNPMGLFYGHWKKDELKKEIEEAKKRAKNRDRFTVVGKTKIGIQVFGKGETIEEAVKHVKGTARKTGIIISSLHLKKEGEWIKL